jgi:hypothetical protein
MRSTLFSPGRYALFPGRYAGRSRGVRRLFMGDTPFSAGPRCWCFHRGYAVFRGAETRGQDHFRTIIIRSVFTAGTPFASACHGRSPFSAAAGEFRVSWKPVVRRRFHRRYAIRGDTRGLCLVAFMRGSPSPDAPRIDSWTDSLPGLTNSILPPVGAAASAHRLSRPRSSCCARTWRPCRLDKFVGRPGM